MWKLICSAVIFATLTACSGVKNEPLPKVFDQSPTWERIRDRLSEDEKRLLAGYVMRREFGGTQADDVVTVGDALAAQRKWLNANAAEVNTQASGVGVPREESKSIDTYGFSEPAFIGDFEFVIKRVEQRDSVGSAMILEKASDGGTLVAITYTLKNTRAQPAEQIDGDTLRLLDPNGVAYAPHSSKTNSFTIDNDFDGRDTSTVNPGIKINNAQVWEVSKEQFNPKTWTLSFEGNENVRFSLQ